MFFDKGITVKDTRTLVIGLGNPILGDDGVGWKVGEAVQEALKTSAEWSVFQGHQIDIDIECLAEGGLRLMEVMIGYDYVVVIDAITTANHPIGFVSVFPVEALPERAVGHFASPHNTTLQTALLLGREMGLSLPERVMIIGIEAQKVYDLSEELTPPVKEAVPQAIQETLCLLKTLIVKTD
jgi:hydrogenase maturation protease